MPVARHVVVVVVVRLRRCRAGGGQNAKNDSGGNDALHLALSNRIRRASRDPITARLTDTL
jgi:hypothetical protein